MKRQGFRWLSIFVGASLLSCGGGRSAKNVPPEGFLSELAVSRLAQGEDSTYSEMKPDYAVRTSDGAFQSTWKKISSSPAPAVDFDGTAVLIALRGQQPKAGFGIRILGIEVKGDTMIIQVLMVNPKGLSGTKQTSPYDVVAVELDPAVKKFRFVDYETGKTLEETAAQ